MTADGFWLTGPGEVEAAPADRPAAPRTAVALALGAAALAAIAVPGNPPGLGIGLVAAGLAGAVVAARPSPVSLDRAVYGALTLILASMAVVRSAGWIVALDLMGAVGLATLAVLGVDRWADLARSPLTVLSRSHQAVPFLGRAMVGHRTRVGRLAPAFRGVALGAALLVVFGALFLSADAAFAELAQRLVPEWDLGLLPARVLVFAAALFLAGSLAAAGPRYAALGRPWAVALFLHPVGIWPRRRLGRTEWAVALGLLDLLFLAFVIVQLTVLFGGRDHVLTTAGLTYAEYARQGFFQLVVVAALTLAVIAGAVWLARRERAADTRLLQVLLGLLCVLTLVVLASALRRLSLYESVFGFTRLRISVHAAILWMAVLLGLVLVAGIRMRGRWLPRAAVGVTAAGLFAFTLLNPDGLIASKNVDRYQPTGRLDLAYLASLSPDAVPALSSLPGELAGCVLLSHAGLSEDADPLLGWNYSRWRARSILRTIETDPPAPGCSDVAGMVRGT